MDVSWRPGLAEKVQALHFKGGQEDKTGTDGHLSGEKVQGKIAEVRGLEPGQAPISPARVTDLHTRSDFRRVADEVREPSGGIPFRFKLLANHVGNETDFALERPSRCGILQFRPSAALPRGCAFSITARCGDPETETAPEAGHASRVERLARDFRSTVKLMQVLARACAHRSMSDFRPAMPP